MNLSIIVLTMNERENLARTLDSLPPVNGALFVVDSGSTDGTQDIAASRGAQVVHHKFETHAQQWAWALSTLPLQSDWVLGIDADQSLTPELATEISHLFSDHGRTLDSIDGVFLNRRYIWRGKWIRHGTIYPKYLLKLFRRSKVYVDPNELLDFHFYISGPTIKLRHDIIEQNKKEDDISSWTQKHNHYATLQARQDLKIEMDGYKPPLVASLWGNPDQRMLWLRGLYRGAPQFVRPTLYFLYRYFVALGFLDGGVGLLYHFLHGFWWRLLVDVKLKELRDTASDSNRTQC